MTHPYGYAFVDNLQATKVDPGGAIPIGMIRYPGSILSVWTDEELAGLNILPIKVAAPPPPGSEVLSEELRVIDGEPYLFQNFQEIPDLVTPLVEAVNEERDRRIDGGMTHAGHVFQTRASDRENIANLGLLALMQTSSGAATPGDLRWLRPDKDFEWITADNQRVTMDAFAMRDFYQAGMAFKDALTFFARDTKDWLLDPARTRQELIDFDLASLEWPV